MVGPVYDGTVRSQEAGMADETVSIKGTEVVTTEETKVPCEVYSRIVGYLRPVQNWNKGKKQEFAERRTYRIREETTE